MIRKLREAEILEIKRLAQEVPTAVFPCSDGCGREDHATVGSLGTFLIGAGSDIPSYPCLCKPSAFEMHRTDLQMQCHVQ